ncbi:MAG: Gfo/Idh/MocA family protein [Verrucomicrobiia bacterium]
MLISRRRFIGSALITSCGAIFGASPPFARTTQIKYKASIIGRTGGGDYGHNYDLIFKDIEEVQLVAIADSNPQGLEKAALRSGALRKYTDYREMLDKEKPELVCIAPRHPDCHTPMAIAASEVALGIFMEKPMAESPEECDKILNAAEKRNVKIQIAHNRRWTVDFLKVKYLIQQGLIGEVREVNFHGKQDSRSGGEDLIVLGTHDFDIMRFYFGDPQWCFATVRSKGKDITRNDIAKGKEPILVAGDSINAMFAFRDNLIINWASIKRNDHWNTNFSRREKWAFEILGTKGIIAYQSGFEFGWLNSPFFVHKDSTTYRDLPEPSGFKIEPHNVHPIKNLIHAIENNTQPMCSGYDGRWTIEMVCAVYQSERDRTRISFPLKDRRNPLKYWG